MVVNLFISNFKNLAIKKYLLHIAIGSAILFSIDFFLGNILNNFYFTCTSGLFQRTTFSMEETDADLLIFGTSRANHHYDVKLVEDDIGMTAYNTGRDGNSIFYQTAVLQSVLERYTPKKIILDFTGTFENSQKDYDRLSSLMPYYKTHPEIRKIVELKSPFEKIKLKSKIYPFNSLLTTIIVGNLELNQNRRKNKGAYNGYVPLIGVYQKQLDSLFIKDYYELDNNKVEVFEEFIKLVTLKKIEIIVVYSPVYYLYEEDYSIKVCKDICNRYNVNFVDFSKDPDFLNSMNYFKDRTHLNSDGAKLLTNKVLEEMKKNNGQQIGE